MKSTKIKNLIAEADTSRSLQAERVIAILISIQNLSNSDIEKSFKTKNMSDDFEFLFRFFNKSTDDVISIVKNIIAKIRPFGFPAEATTFGSRMAMPTDTWITKYKGESTKIMPKTDVLNSSFHHSVKQKGKIQVLDGSRKQTGALVLYTMDQLKDVYSEKIKTEVEKEVSQMQSIVAKLSRIPDREKYNKFVDDFKKKNPNANADDIKAAAKKARLIVGGGDIRGRKVPLSADAEKDLILFEKNLKKLNDKLSNIFSKIESSSDFKRIFLTESMSGNTMFGSSNPASANNVITWDINFKDINSMSILQAVKEVLPSFNKPPAFETKSSGLSMTPVAKIAVDLAKIQKQYDELWPQQSEPGKFAGTTRYPNEQISESFIKVMNENMNTVRRGKIEEMMMFLEYGKSIVGRYHKKIKHLKESLNEGRLDEGTFWEKIKSIFNSMVSAVKKIGQKLSEYFSSLKTTLYGSASDIFDFFGLEIEVEPEYKVEVVF
jgi:hypothetical protein